MNPEKMFQVDHHNSDGLDNRRENLRICTRQQNIHHRATEKRGSSGKKGVHRNGNLWAARIGINGKQLYLGTYKTVDEAAKSYNKAALKYHGKFAYLNQ